MCEICESCKFWQWVNGGNSPRDKWGECRRHAPCPQLLLSTGNINYDNKNVQFPITAGDDWCGEFEEK